MLTDVAKLKRAAVGGGKILLKVFWELSWYRRVPTWGNSIPLADHCITPSEPCCSQLYFTHLVPPSPTALTDTVGGSASPRGGGTRDTETTLTTCVIFHTCSHPSSSAISPPISPGGRAHCNDAASGSATPRGMGRCSVLEWGHNNPWEKLLPHHPRRPWSEK